MSKHWRDVLGDDPIDCFVDRKEIVRWLGRTEGKDQFKVLWTFESNDEARACFREWKEQCEAHRKKVSDENLSSKLIAQTVRL